MFDGIELAADADAVAVDDDADYYSNRNDKGEDTCHEKKLDGDHLNLPPLARSTDATSKVEKACRKDISRKERIFMITYMSASQTNLSILRGTYASLSNDADWLSPRRTTSTAC
jgi:hypothetical protein